MIPAEVRAEEWAEHAVTFVLVFVRAEPVEAGIERDVPRIAQTAHHDLQIAPPVVAPQHAPHVTPVVVGILIGVAIVGGLESLRLGKIFAPGGVGRPNSSRKGSGA